LRSKIPAVRKGLEGTSGSLCEPLVYLREAQIPKPRKARSGIFAVLRQKFQNAPKFFFP
jgi:hypothetical protein